MNSKFLSLIAFYRLRVIGVFFRELAFQAARRAILRCQETGYSLPPDKYEQWKTIEMTFNPEQMRLR